jgi:hypothetical protein
MRMNMEHMAKASAMEDYNMKWDKMVLECVVVLETEVTEAIFSEQTLAQMAQRRELEMSENAHLDSVAQIEMRTFACAQKYYGKGIQAALTHVSAVTTDMGIQMDTVVTDPEVRQTERSDVKEEDEPVRTRTAS